MQFDLGFWIGVGLAIVGIGFQLAGVVSRTIGWVLVALGGFISTVALFIAGVDLRLLLGAWILIAFFAFLVYRRHISRQTINSDKKLINQKLINNLKPFVNKHSEAHIQFASMAQQPMAEALDAIFRLAGWRTNFGSVPLEAGGQYQYIEGIQLSGFNSHLVNSVSKQLKDAGYSGLATRVEQTTIVQDSPKYLHTQNRISVVVGHEKPAS